MVWYKAIEHSFPLLLHFLTMNISSLSDHFIQYSISSLCRKCGKNPGDNDYPCSACTIPCTVGKNRVLGGKNPTVTKEKSKHTKYICRGNLIQFTSTAWPHDPKVFFQYCLFVQFITGESTSFKLLSLGIFDLQQQRFTHRNENTIWRNTSLRIYMKKYIFENKNVVLMQSTWD